MYKALAIALVAVVAFAPVGAYAKAKETCKYLTPAGKVATGVYTSVGGDGALCVDKKGKGHPVYVKQEKKKKGGTLRLLDGRVVAR